mmetsp:Transcript_29914/g.62943  ORF Transcript_29914/g.62943 Transcript_29914/m.62943 type:complete len:142 (+) Transcript_29914:219-644(+)
MKQVIFAEVASLRLYPMDPSYEHEKSYNKADIKEFGRSTLIAAARIKNQLATNHLAAMKNIECLVEIGVAREEIVGIEHLISTNSLKDIVKAREMHVMAIFLEQEKQRIVGRMNEKRIAAISAQVSEKASASARVRAGVAP